MLRSPVRGAEEAFAITPSDTADFVATRGVYIGGAGNLRVLMVNGDDVTFVALAVGVVHPFVVKRVFATSTTATDIVALR